MHIERERERNAAILTANNSSCVHIIHLCVHGHEYALFSLLTGTGTIPYVHQPSVLHGCTVPLIGIHMHITKYSKPRHVEYCHKLKER